MGEREWEWEGWERERVVRDREGRDGRQRERERVVRDREEVERREVGRWRERERVGWKRRGRERVGDGGRGWRKW